MFVGKILTTLALLWMKSSTGSVVSMLVCNVSRSLTTSVCSNAAPFVAGTRVLVNGGWLVSGMGVKRSAPLMESICVVPEVGCNDCAPATPIPKHVTKVIKIVFIQEEQQQVDANYAFLNERL